MAGGKQAEGLRASLGQASPRPRHPAVSPSLWTPGGVAPTAARARAPVCRWERCTRSWGLSCSGPLPSPPLPGPWRPRPGGSFAFPELESRGPGTCIWAGGCRAVDPSLQPLPPKAWPARGVGENGPSFLPAGGPRCHRRRQARAGVCEVGGRLSHAGPGQGRGGGRAGACRWLPMGWRQGAGLGWGACLWPPTEPELGPSQGLGPLPRGQVGAWVAREVGTLQAGVHVSQWPWTSASTTRAGPRTPG